MSPSPTSRLRRSLRLVHQLIRSSLRCVGAVAPAPPAGGRAGQPHRHRELAVAGVVRRRQLAASRARVEAAVRQPLRAPARRRSPAARARTARAGIPARAGEVDDQQAAARRQHARGLAHGALRIAQEVQHLVHDHGVGGLVGERQIVDVALAHLRMREAGALELGARVGEHGRAEVEAEAAPEARREQLQHAARAGAEVDQQIERAGAERLATRPPRPRPRPRAARGCCPTRRRGPGSRPAPPPRARACRASARRRSRTSTGSARSTRLQDQARQLAAAPVLGQPEVDPAALGRALDQAGLGQQLQMPADARLALAEDAGEVLDVELARRQQHQHAQPRRLRHGLQHADGRRRSQRRTPNEVDAMA